MATRIPYIFATNGDTSTVPDETSTDELSWEDGWSDAYALDTDESGYRYIDRSEMNYLFNVLSANIKEWQEQVFPAYSDEISYPEGAVILYTDDVFYEATTTTTAASVPSVSDDWVEYTRSGELSALISANTTSIETNATNIATNTSDIATNTSDIEELQDEIPDRFLSSAQTITSGGSLTISHGLSTSDIEVDFYIKCITADGDYPVGRSLKVSLNSSGISATRWNSLSWDDTNIYFTFSTTSSCFITSDSSGDQHDIDNASWNLYVTAQTRP